MPQLIDGPLGPQLAELVDAVTELLGDHALVDGEPVAPQGGGRAGTSIVAIGGSVCAGKTVFAKRLKASIGGRFPTKLLATVSADGFLLPNARLEALGLIERKGFPESYDNEALVAFFSAVKGHAWPVEVPHYSHETFDIVGGAPLARCDLVVLEGINATQSPAAGLADLCVYLDASEELLRTWFVRRLLGFIELAPTRPGGFYDKFVDWDIDRRTTFAHWVWDNINLPNLRDHIAPSKNNADWIVTLGPDHEPLDVSRRDESPC